MDALSNDSLPRWKPVVCCCQALETKEAAVFWGRGAENAGPVNERPRRIWKMKDHEVSEKGL